MSSIINGYKTQIENSDLGSVRELTVEVRKQGLSSRELASHIRLCNFLRESGVPEEEIEEFISNIHSSGIAREKVIDYVNQVHVIAKDELYFLICESYFWCATSTSSSYTLRPHLVKDETIAKFPLYDGNRISVIPFSRG